MGQLQEMPEYQQRAAVFKALQEHQQFSGPMSYQVWARIEQWIQGEPLLLPLRDELLEAFETCDWNTQEEGMHQVKAVTHHLCTHHVKEWGTENSRTELYRRSLAHLLSMNLPAAAPATPEDLLVSAFATPTGFNYNLFLLDLQLCEREFGLHHVTEKRIRMLMENNLRFAQVMGSCRKDVFASFHRTVSLSPVPSGPDSRMQTLYDAECFELTGSEEDGSLQTLPRKKVLQQVHGTMPDLDREGCAAMGAAFNGMFDFQRRAFDRYFVAENLDRFLDLPPRGWKRLIFRPESPPVETRAAQEDHLRDDERLHGTNGIGEHAES